MQLENKRPDKPINKYLVFLRDIVRKSRIYKLHIFNIGKIKIGENVHLGKGAQWSVPQSAKLGNNIAIAGNFLVQTNLEMGDECLISSKVSFIGHDHDLFDEAGSAYFSGRLEPSTVKLEGNNFIGFGRHYWVILQWGRERLLVLML